MSISIPALKSVGVVYPFLSPSFINVIESLGATFLPAEEEDRPNFLTLSKDTLDYWNTVVKQKDVDVRVIPNFGLPQYQSPQVINEVLDLILGHANIDRVFEQVSGDIKIPPVYRPGALVSPQLFPVSGINYYTTAMVTAHLIARISNPGKDFPGIMSCVPGTQICTLQLIYPGSPPFPKGWMIDIPVHRE